MEIKECYVGQFKVRPKKRWTPWENTIAYYPLKDNFNDESGNNRNLVNSWAVITTQDWLKCWYYNWNSYSAFNGFSLWNTARTINTWVYCTWTSWYWWVVHISDGELTPTWSLGIQFTNWKARVWFSDRASSSASLYTNVSVWWHNVITTQSGATTKLYVDGALIGTNSNFPSQSRSPTWWAVWSKYYSSYTEKITWYISEVILENKERTAQEVVDYYNLTKTSYGIS